MDEYIRDAAPEESIFPFMDFPEEFFEVVETTGPTKEWAWDFERDEFKLKDGKPYTVEGKEAVKIWAYKALTTQRYRYQAYTWNYGSELEELIGKGYSKGYIDSEVKRMLEDCLLMNDNITAVTNLKIEFSDNLLTVDCELETPYGEVSVIVPGR